MDDLGFVVPEGATDCHMHIFGNMAAYPPAAWRAYDPTPATLPALGGIAYHWSSHALLSGTTATVTGDGKASASFAAPFQIRALAFDGAGDARFELWVDAGAGIENLDVALTVVGGAPLAGLATSTGNDPAPDPDDDVNGDDNGTQNGAVVVSRAVTLTDNGEPTSEDGNNDTNLTVDFGFIGDYSI